MSQLTNNTTNLQAILDAVNALPEAGSGGGGASVETCSVTLNVVDEFGMGLGIAGYAANVETNGAIETAYMFSNSVTETVLNNVLCGSVIVVAYSGSVMEASATGGGEQLGMLMGTSRVFRAPTTAGANCVITAYG